MVAEFRRQFRWRKFKLDYGYADDFVLHQWQETTNVEVLFLLYRFLFASSLLIIGYITLRQSLWENIPTWKRTVYVSNWILLVCFVNALFGLVLVCCNFAFQDEQNSRSTLEDRPCLIKLYWVLNTIAIDCSVATFFCFWIVVYNWENRISIISKIYHTVIPLYIIMDFWISSIPVRVLHYYITLLFALIYIVFSIIYQGLRGTNIEGDYYIYGIFNWRDHPVKASLYSLLALFSLLVIRFLVYGMHRLKNFFSKWIYNDEMRTLDTGRSFSSADDSLSNLAVLK